jgi:hypothetical protein
MILACIALILVIIIGVYIPVTYGQTATQEQKESYQELINYCFQHADRPNPIEDLIDKGFLSSNFTGQTCISVRESYNTIVRELQIEKDKQEKALLEKEQSYSKYLECARNKTTTFEECNRIREGIK